jgi:hypothetical protein
MTSSSSSEPPPLPRAAVRGLAQDLLASLLSLKGRTTEAVAQRRAAVEKLEEILGPEHPELQPSLDQLAIDLLRLEDFAGATPVLQRTYEYRVAHLGPEHPDTLERLAVLTEGLLGAGLPAAAQPLLERQLAVSERLKGPEHEDTLAVIQLLAKSHEQQGNRSSAEALLRRAQAGFERTLGLTHSKSLASLYALFEYLSEGPDPAAAEPFGEKLVSASQKAHGPSHPLSVSAVYLLANLYGRRKNFAAGIAVVRHALAAFPSNQTSLGVEHAKLQSLLAALLDLAGQIDEAEALARSAAYALHTHLGPNHADTDRVYRHAIDLSKRRSLRTPLGRFRLRCLRILARILSLSYPKLAKALWGRASLH